MPCAHIRRAFRLSLLFFYSLPLHRSLNVSNQVANERARQLISHAMQSANIRYNFQSTTTPHWLHLHFYRRLFRTLALSHEHKCHPRHIPHSATNRYWSCLFGLFARAVNHTTYIYFERTIQKKRRKKRKGKPIGEPLVRHCLTQHAIHDCGCHSDESWNHDVDAYRNTCR